MNFIQKNTIQGQHFAPFHGFCQVVTCLCAGSVIGGKNVAILPLYAVKALSY